MTHPTAAHVSARGLLIAARFALALTGVCAADVPTAAAAQATAALEGFVRDATGATVSGARIDIGGPTATHTETDATGHYRITGLRPGRYTLRVQLVGFAPRTETVEVTPGTATRDLTLQDLVASDMVTVAGIAAGDRFDNAAESGSRLGLTVRETPAIINVLTFAEAQSRGLESATEALNSIPGVAAANPPSILGVTAMRGFAGDAVSRLLDGTPVDMSGRDPDSWTFERIEVLKGPAAVLYGTGALAGAVNFVSKRPDFNTRRGGALISYGSLNSARFAAEATGPIGSPGSRAAYRLDVAGATTDGFVASSDLRSFAVAGGVDVRLGRSVTLGFSADHSRDGFDVAYWGTPLVPRSAARQPSRVITDSRDYVVDAALHEVNYNFIDAVTDAHITWLRGKVQWQITPAWTLVSNTYHYDALRRWRNAEAYIYQPDSGLLSRSVSLIDHDHQFVGNRTTLSSDTRIGGRRHRFMVGIEGNGHNLFNPRRFTAAPLVDRFNPDRGLFPADTTASGYTTQVNNESATHLISVFAEDALVLVPRVTLVAGFRYDRLSVDRGIVNLIPGTDTRFSNRFGPVSWRAGVVVDAAPRTQLFAQYTTAAAPLGTPLLISQANLDFKLTTGDSWEGGIKSTILDRRLDVTASVFTITQDDILTRDQTNPNLSIQGGTQASTGAEFAIAGTPARGWRLDANVTVMDARFVRLIEAGGLDRSGNVPMNVSERLAGLWTAYAFERIPITIGGGVRYRGAFFLNNANSTRASGFALLDAQASWRLGSGDITLRGKNLTDALYADWTGFGGNQVMLGAPRTVDVSYHVRF